MRENVSFKKHMVTIATTQKYTNAASNNEQIEEMLKKECCKQCRHV